MSLAWLLRPLLLDTEVFWKHVHYDNSFLWRKLTFELSMTLTHCQHQPDQISSLIFWNIAMVKNVWWQRCNKSTFFQSLIWMIQKVWLKNIPQMNYRQSSWMSISIYMHILFQILHSCMHLELRKVEQIMIKQFWNFTRKL